MSSVLHAELGQTDRCSRDELGEVVIDIETARGLTMLAVQSYSGVHDGEPYSRLRYNVNVPRTIDLAFSRRF